MEDVNKRGRIFFFLYLNLSAVPKKFTYILTFSSNWNKHAKKTFKFIFKVTFSLPSPSSMRKLPWYLKESLRTYKLLLLQNEYGDPAILFQTTTNRQSLTKISLQVRLEKNDLKNWLNGNFGLNLQLLKLRLRLRRVISSFRLLYLLCFHEASLKVAKNRLGSADHRNWRPRYVCHAFTIPKNYHAMLFICVHGMNARPKDFSRMHATRILSCKSQALLTPSLIWEIDASGW